MIFYDIHTHHAPASPTVIAIVNSIIKEKELPNKGKYRSYGIHPWYIMDVDRQMALLRTFASLPETVAIGEVGLDKRAEAPFFLQEEVFQKQVFLAEEIKKPLIIHCVKAWQELISLKRKIKPSMAWILHGFRGKEQLVDQLLSEGFYFSFGKLFNPSAIKKTWPDHILTETDDKEIPIEEIYSTIAETMQLPLEVVVRQIAENSKQIFAL